MGFSFMKYRQLDELRLCAGFLSEHERAREAISM